MEKNEYLYIIKNQDKSLLGSKAPASLALS